MNDFHAKDAEPFCACRPWRHPTGRSYAVMCWTCGRFFFVEPSTAYC